jgi:ribosomal 50S subunit-associated protein YjgA (DUF615 family)
MSATAHHPHRVARAVAHLGTELTELADASLWSMNPEETAATITDLLKVEAQLAELKSRLLTHAAAVDVPSLSAASSVANWLAHATRLTHTQAHRTTRLATALETHEPTRTALAQGRVHLEQAEVILHALDQLPDHLDQAVITQAETHLVDQAADFDAKALRNLGRHLLEVVAPDTADAHQARLLEKEERQAAAATRLAMWEDGHGRVHGRFTLDTLTGAMLKKALLAFAAPKHRASQGPLGERRPTPERLGHAFTELIHRYPTKKLPRAGGLNATVVVTMTLKTLMGGLKAARLDTGDHLSPGAARRLACEAGIIPAVLGGDSRVLDLGRTRRFHSPAQRIAKTIETGGCEIESCDWPPGMTHLHHPVRWADGGGTNRDAIMICPHHHARAHDTRYQMTKLPTGKYGFHRRT